jgi:hypothetical protein
VWEDRRVSIEEALAKNEAVFRAINERIRELGNRFGEEGLEFICECADETCTERVRLTLDQYEHIRALPIRFVVVAGHEATPLVERVVFSNPQFSIVNKVGVAAQIATEQDPRGGPATPPSR